MQVVGEFAQLTSLVVQVHMRLRARQLPMRFYHLISAHGPKSSNIPVVKARAISPLKYLAMYLGLGRQILVTAAVPPKELLLPNGFAHRQPFLPGEVQARHGPIAPNHRTPAPAPAANRVAVCARVQSVRGRSSGVRSRPAVCFAASAGA